MTEAIIRAWWAQRQALDGTMRDTAPSAILESAGWARSVGGVSPYLTLWARGRISREAVDAAVATLEIHELPSARGCTYVLPVCDYALGLKLSQPSLEPEMKAAWKLGVTEKEVDKLCAAVLKALGKATLEVDAIREGVGGAARSLGEEGKKKGLTTTLPLALGRLQSEGEVRRVPINGRLDQQRYKYVAWTRNPLAGFKLSEEECAAELARRYFTWIGPATLAEFQWFSSFSGKVAKAAIESLDLTPLEAGSERLMFAEDLDSLRTFRVPTRPQVELVSSLDSLSLLRRDVKALVAEEHRDHALFQVKDARAGSTLMDLPNHAIVDRGEVVGLWEFDPDAGAIAWATFAKPTAAMKAAVKEAEAYVAGQLGDARAFSLDSPKSRAPKIAHLRGAAV